MSFRMQVVAPRSLLLDPERLGRAIENALDGAALAAKVDFQVTAQTWKQQPEFTIEARPGERVVRTTDRVYLFVTGGTRPHLIRVRQRRALAFSSQFQAKTAKRMIASFPGGRGAVDRFAKSVRHPGTEAREFEKEIAEKWQELLPRTLQRAIDAEM